MHLGFQTMRTELKRIDALLLKGNIPKPENNPSSDRRDDYDRDRYDRGGGGRGDGYRGPTRGFTRKAGNYRGRGGGGRYRD